MRILWKTVSKALLKSRQTIINCSSLIYQASHFIMGFYQVGQAWLCLGETMLTTSDDFHVLNVTGNGSQD